ncbi:MAG: UDP-3-O-(3-hydroxymyristoyl)glucosamine N-acyltransferase [Rhodospirillaceae bacterium]|nr:UDP-3-O-(3-hydroxymyristoyl)glucosamine N-acyltransferase [Rhodospirillaceae bacterium]
MPDSRFYHRAGPFRLADIAGRCGARLTPGADPEAMIHDIGAIDAAKAGDIIYFADPAYVVALSSSKCTACVTTEQLAAKAPGCAVLVADDPRAAFAEIAGMFYPDEPMTGVAESARIAPDAVLGEGAAVAHGAVIGAKAAIGKRSRIGANAVIGHGVVVGDDCRISPNVTLSHCLIENRVIIHAGVQIGQDGFGFVPSKDGHRKVPQLGRVVVHDDVEIGANTTIDRGAAGDTVVGAGTKIDNLVQIGHNVQIGRRCIIVSQVGISGSCKIGDGAVIGGQAGFADHVTVGEGAQIAAKTGVMRDVGPGEIVMGYPARPIRQFWRDVAAVSRLTRRDK